LTVVSPSFFFIWVQRNVFIGLVCPCLLFSLYLFFSSNKQQILDSLGDAVASLRTDGVLALEIPKEEVLNQPLVAGCAQDFILVGGRGKKRQKGF
jgi:hypothetical protein